MMRTIVRILLATTLAVLLALAPKQVLAQRELIAPMGAKHTLALDQLSGFRASAVNGINGAAGFSYAGPIGFAHQSYSETGFNNAGDTTVRTTTFWLAPSVDFFIIDNLSLGGLVEISTTSGSVDRPVNAATTQTTDLPSTLNFTFL